MHRCCPWHKGLHKHSRLNWCGFVMDTAPCSIIVTHQLEGCFLHGLEVKGRIWGGSDFTQHHGFIALMDSMPKPASATINWLWYKRTKNCPCFPQRSKGQTSTAVLSRYHRAPCYTFTQTWRRAAMETRLRFWMGLRQQSPQSSLLSVCILHLFQQKYPPCCWYFQKALDKTQCQCCQDDSVWVRGTKLITANEFTEYLQHDWSSCSWSQQRSPATEWASRIINPGALVIWGGIDGRDRNTNAETWSLGQVEASLWLDAGHSSVGNSCCYPASCGMEMPHETLLFPQDMLRSITETFPSLSHYDTWLAMLSIIIMAYQLSRQAFSGWISVPNFFSERVVMQWHSCPGRWDGHHPWSCSSTVEMWHWEMWSVGKVGWVDSWATWS